MLFDTACTFSRRIVPVGGVLSAEPSGPLVLMLWAVALGTWASMRSLLFKESRVLLWHLTRTTPTRTPQRCCLVAA